jgi:hypothetical protein
LGVVILAIALWEEERGWLSQVLRFLTTASQPGISVPGEIYSLIDFCENSGISDRLGAEIKTPKTLEDIVMQ